jgi:hypothetical protein
MWVKSEDGRLYNLEHAYEVTLEGDEDRGYFVEARFNIASASDFGGSSATIGQLSDFKPEEEGRKVLERIASTINRKDTYLDLSAPPHSSTL